MAAINEMLLRGRTAYQKSSSTIFRSGIFILLLGAVFLLIGIASCLGSQPNYFFLATGALFVAWGISNFISARRFRQK